MRPLRAEQHSCGNEGQTQEALTAYLMSRSSLVRTLLLYKHGTEDYLQSDSKSSQQELALKPFMLAVTDHSLVVLYNRSAARALCFLHPSVLLATPQAQQR